MNKPEISNEKQENSQIPPSPLIGCIYKNP